MGVLLMLLTIGGLFVAVILLIVSFWKKIDWLKKFVFGGLAVWFVLYAILLFGSSLFSEEKTLAFDEPKEFCGFYLDCHMHASVSGVRKTKKIGDKTAKGEFYIVKVKIFSDAKREPLNMITPNFEVVDAEGKRFESTEKPDNSWEQKVPAGGSFEKEIVFDLPSDIKSARLDIREGYGVDHAIEAVLIGDEDSILHKRTRFSLEAQTANLN